MKRIPFFLCLFFLFLTSQTLFSQTSPELSFTVKGILVDSVSKETIPYVTVSLSAKDKPETYIKRLAAGLKGEFEMNINKSGDYIISFESVGMNKKAETVNVSSGEKVIDLGKISMSASQAQLSEVTVSANKPLVKVDLDKIIYDTKSDPEAQSNNVLEMLKKVPMVTVDGEDKIQVKGSSNFKIYMNGKPSNMVSNNPSQVLKSIPASSVKNIEVITEPGAKYDAEGLGGIINIVTERSLGGYTGTVRAGADSHGGFNGGLYFSTKMGKFGITTNLNYGNYESPDNSSYNKRENFSSETAKYIIQSNNGGSSYKFGHGNLEASYEFDSLNLVSLTFGGYTGGFSSTSDGYSYMLNAQMDTLLSYSQKMDNKGDWGGMNLTLDYQRTFKKPDQLFTVSYQLSHTPDNSDYLSDITGIRNYSSSLQRITSNANGDEHTFQVDYTEPFNKKHVMELGLKYILRLNKSDNAYTQYNTLTNLWETMQGRPENDLNQTQNILGAYGSYTLKLDKMSMRAGLRLEQTRSMVELADTNFTPTFTNLVPSISMTYRFSPTSNLRLSYNQRISRPSIWYLNPFYDDSNPQSISQGNPDLAAEVDNSFSLNYSNFTQKLNFNAGLYTSFTNNSIERVSTLLNDSVVYSTYQNIGLSSNTGLSMYANWQPTPKVRIYGNGSATYTYMSTNDDSGLGNKGMRYTLSCGTQFMMPWEIKWNTNGGYYSPGISLQGKQNAYYYYSMSLSRDFLEKKLNVSVYARDFLEKSRDFTSYTETSTYRSDNISTRPAFSFGLSLSYRFGEMKEQIKKVQRSIENDDVKSGGNQSSGGGGQ
ncbi:MAG: TonB-dependent receptor [Bacteroidales bacterium]|nr:TonB-dependent receptor [Bacteroidales bacterium]